MHEELWQGVEFKVAEAHFFLEQMSKVLLPPRLTDRTSHPAYGVSAARWQPDFYFFVDAFIGATRSIPDVIQKCFGWDRWSQPIGDDEKGRRNKFQKEFKSLYLDFIRLPISEARVVSFHWSGVPSVQTKAKVLGGQEYTGKPGQPIPSLASKQFPAGTDPAFLAIASQPLPVEPSREDFTLEIPRAGGSTESKPLFSECQAYLSAAEHLVQEAKELCDRIHGGFDLTPPLTARF